MYAWLKASTWRRAESGKPSTRTVGRLPPKTTSTRRVPPAWLASALIRTAKLWRDLSSFEREIKNDHERLIRIAKVRTETRKVNTAACQLNAFSLLLSNFMTVLSEMLPPDFYRALQVRIKKDFEMIPRRAFEPGTVSKKPN